MPAARLLNTFLVLKINPFKLKRYGPVPPLAVTVAEPLKSPLHVTLTVETDAVSAEAGSEMVLLPENEHPVAGSVTVIEYVPAESPFITKNKALKLPDVVAPFGAVKV